MNKLRTSKNNTAILRTLLLLLLPWLMICPEAAEAGIAVPQDVIGNRIALKIDNEDLYNSEQLREVKTLGIDLLEVSFPTPVDYSVLDNFFLLLDTEENYRTIHELNSLQETILNSVQLRYNSVPRQLRDNLAAVKLFNYPADFDLGFAETVEPLLEQLSDSIEEPLYYQSAFPQPYPGQNGFDFTSGRVITGSDSLSIPEQPVLLFVPSENLSKSLRNLQVLLNQSLNNSDSIIIIPAEWFFARMESGKWFPQVISSYLDGNSIEFPMPDDGPGYPPVNWPVTFLVIIWGSFIIHYKYQPIYKAALPRYFLNHSFFVHDIMQHRIRSVSPGIIVSLQHAVLTGFFFYLLAEAFISKTGYQSLFTHYPALFYPGFEKVNFFVIGFAASLISHLISIAWLYLLNKELKQFNQAINLYSWPLHINLIIFTLVVYFVQLSSAHNWLFLAASLYFIVWFGSFNIAAIDAARYLEKFRTMNLFLTIGIHFLLVITGVVLILWLPFLFEPLEMALRLP